MGNVTYNMLSSFAIKNDGECIVSLVSTRNGPQRTVLSRDKPKGTVWDWFFSDEYECFPYDKYDIEVPESE